MQPFSNLEPRWHWRQTSAQEHWYDWDWDEEQDGEVCASCGVLTEPVEQHIDTGAPFCRDCLARSAADELDEFHDDLGVGDGSADSIKELAIA